MLQLMVKNAKRSLTCYTILNVAKSKVLIFPIICHKNPNANSNTFDFALTSKVKFQKYGCNFWNSPNTKT